LDTRTAEADNLKKLLEMSSIDLAACSTEINDLKNTVLALRAELKTQSNHPMRSENSESVMRSIEKHRRSPYQGNSGEFESKILNFNRPGVLPFPASIVPNETESLSDESSSVKQSNNQVAIVLCII